MAGLHLNRHITVQWGIPGLSEAEAGAATSQLLKHMGDHALKRGWRFAWIYVREHGPTADKGPHAHILAHVPAEHAAAFVKLQRGWITRITGRPYAKGTVKTKLIGGALRTYRTSPDLWAANLRTVVSYVLKAAPADVRAALGGRHAQASGVIIGKRSGTSNNLGAAAQRAAGFEPPAILADVAGPAGRIN